MSNIKRLLEELYGDDLYMGKNITPPTSSRSGTTDAVDSYGNSYDANGSPLATLDDDGSPIPEKKSEKTQEETQWEQYKRWRDGSGGTGIGIGIGHSPPDASPPTKYCNHDWILYTGLTEQFNYCKHCNITQSEYSEGK